MALYSDFLQLLLYDLAIFTDAGWLMRGQASEIFCVALPIGVWSLVFATLIWLTVQELAEAHDRARFESHFGFFVPQESLLPLLGRHVSQYAQGTGQADTVDVRLARRSYIQLPCAEIDWIGRSQARGLYPPP